MQISEKESHGVCFGLEGLSMGEARRPNTATALDDSELLQLSLRGLNSLGIPMEEEWVQV